MVKGRCETGTMEESGGLMWRYGWMGVWSVFRIEETASWFERISSYALLAKESKISNKMFGHTFYIDCNILICIFCCYSLSFHWLHLGCYCRFMHFVQLINNQYIRAL